MLEIVQNYEQTAGHFRPLVLLVPGLVGVLLGLFVWLGGLGLRKLLIAIAGAVSGFLCGSLIIGQNTIAVLIITVVTAVIAMIFERFFIAILTALLIGIVCLIVLIIPYVSDENPATETLNTPTGDTMFSLQESIEATKEHFLEVVGVLKQACSEIPAYFWAIIAVAMIVSLVIAFFLKSIASALCCATLGTILIFAGMISLLLFKGSDPLTGISNKPLFYAAVFGGMTAFGTVEQSVLWLFKKAKAKRNKKAKEENQEKKK